MKVEVVVLGSPTLIVLVVSVDVNAAMNSNSFGLSFGMNLRCLAHMRDAFTDLELDSGIIQIRIIIIQNTKSLLSMNSRNVPYDCIKDISKITHSIIHEHKYTQNTEYFILESK